MSDPEDRYPAAAARSVIMRDPSRPNRQGRHHGI